MWRLFNPKYQRVPDPRRGDAIEVYYSRDTKSRDFVVLATAQYVTKEPGTGNKTGFVAVLNSITEARTSKRVDAIPSTDVSLGAAVNSISLESSP